MNSFFLTLSIIFAFITPLVGIYSLLKGTFRPQRMTRFLIFILSLLFVGTLFAQGDRNGIFIALAQLIGSSIILLLALKRGIGGTTPFDFLILFLTMASLVVWKTTQNPTLGLLMSIVTDFIGMIPTLIKTWHLPHTEDWKFYLSDVVASFFSLLSLSNYSLVTLAFPLYIFLINLTSVVLILRRKHVKYSPGTPLDKLKKHYINIL